MTCLMMVQTRTSASSKRSKGDAWLVVELQLGILLFKVEVKLGVVFLTLKKIVSMVFVFVLEQFLLLIKDKSGGGFVASVWETKLKNSLQVPDHLSLCFQLIDNS